MEIHSSILAWKIPCTEEPGGLQSKGSQRIRPNWAYSHTHKDKARNRTCLPTLKTGSDLLPWCQRDSRQCLRAAPILSQALWPYRATSCLLLQLSTAVYRATPEDLEFLLQDSVRLTCICVHEVAPYLIAMTLRIVAPGYIYGSLRPPAAATQVTGSLKQEIRQSNPTHW